MVLMNLLVSQQWRHGIEKRLVDTVREEKGGMN